ncbi:CRISPR-associated protein Cas5, partial [Candidatus Woesearchaeota archaeon]|nr:CRISPR-associated protein Cas5 [Candidatus Woesearchaeota archaeon]
MDKDKLKVLRVKLRSLTASFRQIGFITGYQPTLPAPPLSTIYGVICAAVGKFIEPSETKVGYIFRNKSKSVDLEKIYQVEGNFGFNENIVKREFFYDNQL